MPVVRPAFAYFGAVFAVAFVIGAFRVLVVAPRIGALAAVALEVPVILAVSWLVAGWVLRRWSLNPVQRVGMGALAFGLLMVAELALAVFLFGQTAGEFVGGWGTLPGALGLAGQIGFAIVPALRSQGKG
jgi:hypothetical protein